MSESDIFSLEGVDDEWLMVQRFRDGSVVFSIRRGTRFNKEAVDSLVAWLQDVSSDDNS